MQGHCSWLLPAADRSGTCALAPCCYPAGPRDCVGQNLALAEARAALAMLVGRFKLKVAPRMGGRDGVRAKEAMKLTLQCSGGMWLELEERL